MLPQVHASSARYESVPKDDDQLGITISDSYPDDIDGEIGDISIPILNSNSSTNADFNTLDEPIRDTILRDVKAVCVKFRYVLQPQRRESKLLLKEWDLWGPLLLCTFMAVVLQGSRGSSPVNSNDGGPEFAEVFVIVWVGALVVTLNSKLLGGQMSIFQSVCVLGYCLLAPTLALVLCKIILLFGTAASMFLFFLRLLIALVAFAWATLACMVFLGESQVKGRKALAGYPVCLFYAVICWLVISKTD